ncbi:MAG: hypothetical protein WCF18_03810 [Chthoniobacteraceae bacterium]
MRPTFRAIILIAASSASLHAQNATTALSAIKLLPKGDAKRIARIEAREGNPTPERWYILVHDPADEAGLREYVVAGGAVVASRTLSQFAEGLKAEEVIGGDAVRVDSDRAGKVAQQYALANNIVPATISYQLRKDTDDGTPVWNVTCVDAAGKAVGGVVVAANKGNVLSHTGFTLEPGPEKRLKAEPNEDEDRGDSARNLRKRYVVRSRSPMPVRQAQPVAEKPNFFQRMFGR